MFLPFQLLYSTILTEAEMLLFCCHSISKIRLVEKCLKNLHFSHSDLLSKLPKVVQILMLMFVRYLKYVKQNRVWFWHKQINIYFLLPSMCFVILSAVCYKDDANNFLGFHKLYYCKCSRVYIFWSPTISFVVWFICYVISYMRIDWFQVIISL